MLDIRQRKSHESKIPVSNGSHEISSTNNNIGETKENVSSMNPRHLCFIHWLFMIFYVSALFAFCYWSDGVLPKPRSAEEAGQSEFSEKRAWRYLESMASFGQKPSGSYEAEVLTRNFLMDELARIKSESSLQLMLEIDVQKPNDCYELFFLSHFISCYNNITNIVVKMSNANNASHFGVLLNCHFDSAVGSPGATDDLAACSVMLEILSILSKSKQPLKHNVIFLFNGAEENFLQGSHAFITQHRWRHNIQAFVNMEGAGAGGREFLFQSGPANMWLLHAYLDNAPYPHGSILAQEIFESGILISDTDFRVFRDHGRLSGLDLAFTRNSYLYHSEFDDSDHVTAGSLQRLGENVLATVRAMGNSDCLEKPCPEKDAKVVFFDVLGVFVVQYSRSVAIPLNYFVCCLVVLKILYAMFGKRGNSTPTRGYTWKNIAIQLLVTLISMGAVLLTAFLVCLLVLASNMTMCWYSRWLLLLPLYLGPPVIVGLSLHMWRRSYYDKPQNLMGLETVHFDTVLFILAIVLFIITLVGIQSTYFVLIHLLFPLMRDPIILTLERISCLKRSPNLIFSIQLILLLPVVIVASYAIVEVIHVFIPLVGRSGSALIPEFLIAIILVGASVTLVLFMSNFVYITSNMPNILKTMAVLNAAIVAVMCLPGLAAPFKFSVEAPTWRRLHAQHVHRRIETYFGDPNPLEDSAVWIAALDYRGAADLPRQIVSRQWQAPNCTQAKDLFCALPYYIPARKVVAPAHTLWVSTPQRPPAIERPVAVRVDQKQFSATDRVVVNLTIDGADHISVYITPQQNWTLDYYVFGSKTFSMRNDNKKEDAEIDSTQFIYLASVHPVEPWTFSVALMKSPKNAQTDPNGPVLYVGAASHQMHGKNRQSASLEELDSKIKARRQPNNSQHHWKWAMTLNSFTSDYIGIYA